MKPFRKAVLKFEPAEDSPTIASPEPNEDHEPAVDHEPADDHDEPAVDHDEPADEQPALAAAAVPEPVAPPATELPIPSLGSGWLFACSPVLGVPARPTTLLETWSLVSAARAAPFECRGGWLEACAPWPVAAPTPTPLLARWNERYASSGAPLHAVHV